MTNSIPSGRQPNRLAREKSPYLLQHQFNPVDWFAWGEAAFAKARAEHKPIFLSIGYSTCHWCHVMERESFENEEVAKFLNEHFVSIKVDREERPDVDKIYMTFVQATSGQGGWPLNTFLTPDLKPFYGGTYFPPTSRYGRPSFLELLHQIDQLWRTRQVEVIDSAAGLHERLVGHVEREPSRGLALTPTILQRALETFKGEYDSRHGGFGHAPKFPRPSQPAFVLRTGVRFHDHAAVKMVLHTCERMAAGGMCDQLGGGFARYSVDAEWLVPHFEKMLYDNAQLAQLYLDTYLVSGEKKFAEVARHILRYVQRDMTHRNGGFYSAEDADSEGKEGKFYCWTRAELSALLTPEEFNVATRYFGITEHGNFLDHSDPKPLPGQNVLSIVNAHLKSGDEALLAAAKEKMFNARSKRVRPHLDDKVLSSWNGLMLGAFARAFAVLGDEEYRRAAERNLDFLRQRLWDPKTKTLFHRWREGERDQAQLLDAYAYLLSGVIELYEATLAPETLEFAVELADAMVTKFYDSEHGGFWQSERAATDLILRIKEDYDGAEPSGNSVAILSLLRLAAITGREDFKAKAEASLRLFADKLQQAPQLAPLMLLALDYWLEEPRRIVIVGDYTCSSTRWLLDAAHSVYQPNKILLGNHGPVDPFVKSLPADDEASRAFLCTGTACQPPTRSADVVKCFCRGESKP